MCIHFINICNQDEEGEDTEEEVADVELLNQSIDEVLERTTVHGIAKCDTTNVCDSLTSATEEVRKSQIMTINMVNMICQCNLPV